jgi:integrase
MKRGINRLTATAIRNTNEPGLYNDGFGLNLQVRKFWPVEHKDADGKTRSRTFVKESLALSYHEKLRARKIEAQIKAPYVTKAWLLRFMRDRRADTMGLGSLATVSLAMAREKAHKARDLLAEGINPRLQRNAEREQRRVEAARAAAIPSFLECAEAFIKAKSVEWSNLKHTEQWTSTFTGKNAATARINGLPVHTIDTPLILACLEPIWKATPTTASRMRARVENVLDFAKAKGWRQGDNPAARKLIEYAMPKGSKAVPKEHHAALAYADVPAFMSELRAKEGIAERELEFVVLTGARLGEVLRAEWSEIDLQGRVWTVPAERMKARKEHRVPLSDRAIEILESLPRGGAFLFPGTKAGQAMSERPMRNVLAELRGDVTFHGFRSSLRDWAGDMTSFPREIAEAALAHKVGNATEQAYRRGSALEQRRRLMDAWSDHCEGKTGGENVVSIRARA